MKNLTRTFMLLATIILAQSCNTMNPEPLVIGHRGAMGHEMENTLASIQKALELEVDVIEIDVFKIRSGEIVVFHDIDVSRLSDSNGKIEDYDLKTLSEINLNGGHKVPLLTDVIDLIDNKAKLNIELKGAGTSSDVNAIVKGYVNNGNWALQDFIISSFKWSELRIFRNLNQDIPIAILTEEDPMKAFAIGQELNAEAINPAFTQLNQKVVEEIKAKGFKIYTWTVNEIEDIEAAKAWGVDGIITNYPERIK